MSVAVSCNLSDGVILGVDSAVTLPGPAGVLKNLRKCREAFQLGDKPIGVAFFGLAASARAGWEVIRANFIHRIVKRWLRR